MLSNLTWRQMLWLTLASLPTAVPPLLDPAIGLPRSVAVALLVSATLGVWAVRGDQALKPVLYGALGAAIAAGCLYVFGSVRNYFLPGLILSTVWAPILLASGFTRWPIIGFLLARADRRFITWRRQPRMLHAMRGMTIAWGVFACSRVTLQWWLYTTDKGIWLVVSKHVANVILLGLSLVTLRIAVRLHKASAPASANPAEFGEQPPTSLSEPALPVSPRPRTGI